jgi:hypothetical protein
LALSFHLIGLAGIGMNLSGGVGPLTFCATSVWQFLTSRRTALASLPCHPESVEAS